MSSISIEQLMHSSNVGFGTSGARGLVKDMSDEVCYLYTCAFIQHLCQTGQLEQDGAIALAGDLRPSTQRIMAAIKTAIEDMGHQCIYCGEVATPVLAFYALSKGIAGIMVTGSHIPDDRNGIKFYKPRGEILKTDEAGIRQQQVEYVNEKFNSRGMLEPSALSTADVEAEQIYIQRFVDFFPSGILGSLKIGVYQHSSVIRDTLTTILQSLGAQVVPLGRSETFIPVDTEAVRNEDILLARQWCKEHHLHSIVSTDGDGDRPMLSDAEGNWLRGDILGILCSLYLHADIVVTPVSSNSAVELCNNFKQVIRTQIGSPYVIAAMESILSEHQQDAVVGYEANGGFLQATRLNANERILQPLPTRDSSIVILAVLALSTVKQCPVSGLLKLLPERYTYSDRIKDIPSEKSQAFIMQFNTDHSSQAIQQLNNMFADTLGDIASVDQTDGLRMTLTSGDVVHFRPSGNAPELRCYTEADTENAARKLNQQALESLLNLMET